MKTPSWYIQVTAISRGIHRFPPCFRKTRSSRQVNRGRSSLVSHGRLYISVRIALYALTRKFSKTGLVLYHIKSFKSGCTGYVWSPKRYSFNWSAMLKLMAVGLTHVRDVLAELPSSLNSISSSALSRPYLSHTCKHVTTSDMIKLSGDSELWGILQRMPL